ncbi:MAG: aminotransferase class IV [Candidatus Promineifilaceae bacterium]
MSKFQLFAVTETGTCSLPRPQGVTNLHGLLEGLPVGVYTAFRTFAHNKFLHLEDHLDRLDQSMALLGWAIRLNRPSVRQALDSVCSAYPGPDARVRLDVLAEAAGQLPVDSRTLIALAPYEPVPPSVYEHGVRVGIGRALIRKDPLIKEASFVAKRQSALRREPEMYEYLMLDPDGYLLEGASSNFFGMRDGMLYTAAEGVLNGVARRVVLTVAGKLGIAVQLEPVHVDELARLSEAALSSSSRGLVPIIQIGDQVIGDGSPGPMTRRLIEGYGRYVAREIKPAVEW